MWQYCNDDDGTFQSNQNVGNCHILWVYSALYNNIKLIDASRTNTNL